jgi:hypothetical protein
MLTNLRNIALNINLEVKPIIIKSYLMVTNFD